MHAAVGCFVVSSSDWIRRLVQCRVIGSDGLRGAHDQRHEPARSESIGKHINKYVVLFLPFQRTGTLLLVQIKQKYIPYVLHG